MSARRSFFLALGVHAFTASGLIFGFLALIATVQGDQAGAFMWLGIALVVDGIDGTFARLAKVKHYTPGVDGVTLDNVIDFFTYAIIPALMIWQWALVPLGWGVVAGCLILLSAGYTYAQTNMKLSDNSFAGFPALWNLVAFYLVVLGLGPWTALFVIGGCAVLTLIPTPYVHPFRTPFQGFAVLVWAMLSLWAVSSAAVGYQVLYLGQVLALAQPWFLIFAGSSLFFFSLTLFWTLRPKTA